MNTSANHRAVDSTMSAAAWGMLILLSVVWGGSFFFVGVAVQDLPTLTVVVARVGLAAILLWVFMRIRGLAMPLDRSVWLAFFGMGFLNNVVPFTLIVWGQSHIASGVASILNATTPLFTVILAHLLTSDERLSAQKLLGVFLGLIGVAVMIGGEAVSALGTDVLAQVAILGAATSYGFAVIFGRRFKRMGVSPIATATGQVTASSMMLLPIMIIVDTPWTLPMPGLDTWLSLIGLAAVSTSFAYILYFKILDVAGATNLSLVTLLVPVSAIALGILFLDEVLLPRHVVGMALIGAGLLALDGRVLRMFDVRR